MEHVFFTQWQGWAFSSKVSDLACDITTVPGLATLVTLSRQRRSPVGQGFSVVCLLPNPHHGGGGGAVGTTLLWTRAPP